jgi:hypothetical protein
VNKTRRQQKAAKSAAEFLIKALQYAPLRVSITFVGGRVC